MVNVHSSFWSTIAPRGDTDVSGVVSRALSLPTRRASVKKQTIEMDDRGDEMSGGKHQNHIGWGASCLMILIGMSVIMLSASCGGFAVECAFDADCDLNEACAVGTCRQVCVMDEDCADLATSSPDAEIACRPLTREAEAEAVNVCAPPDFEENSANNDSECVTDEECVEALGSEFARCSLINTCIMPSPDYGILVRDLGEVAEGDEGVGAELLAIYVEDANGAILGWAVSLDYQPAPLATSLAKYRGWPDRNQIHAIGMIIIVSRVFVEQFARAIQAGLVAR